MAPTHSTARDCGPVRSRDLVAAGLSRSNISRKVRVGELVRLSRGVYARPGTVRGEHASLAIVAARVPAVTFCLLTALRLHDLTTEDPAEVWIAIGNKDRAPRIDYPPLRIVRLSPATLHEGTESISLDGVAARITNPAKTVADCFKFRSKVGLDVAIAALREVRRSRRATVDDLWKYAELDRVANVMRPYLEVLA